MTADTRGPHRILVASDVVGDADLVRKLLRNEFDTVFTSTDPERTTKDFELHRPDVLVLAFDTLEKAERYYLGLYRLGDLVHTLRHRTVILCGKDDLQRVYSLCKKSYFDDYVLFWPMSHDGPRLPMAVHHALRQLGADATDAPTAGEFAKQARRLAEMETQLEQHAARGGARIDAASRSLREAQHDIGLALDGFSLDLTEGELRDLIEIKDRPGLQREIERLKSQAIAPRLQAVAASVAPMREWAGELKTEFAAHFESARALQALAERVHPLVLVVDDDTYQHKLLRQLLSDMHVDLVFAASGAEALSTLRRVRPELILMDVEMPDMDGVETTRRIKSATAFSNIAVLMITGHSDKDVVVKSIKAGAADFVVKPFNRDILQGKVRRLLNGP